MEIKFTLHFLILVTSYSLQLPASPQAIGRIGSCDELSVNANLIPACSSGSYGEIKLAITGGLPPYQVHWHDGVTTTSRKLPAGKYQVQVIDALGCEGNQEFTIPELRPVSVMANVKHTSRSGKNNGEISLSVTGGLPPYWYTWISSSQGVLHAAVEGVHQAKKLPSGTYQVLVFDASGCYTEIETVVQ